MEDCKFHLIVFNKCNCNKRHYMIANCGDDEISRQQLTCKKCSQTVNVDESETTEYNFIFYLSVKEAKESLLQLLTGDSEDGKIFASKTEAEKYIVEYATDVKEKSKEPKVRSWSWWKCNSCHKYNLLCNGSSFTCKKCGCTDGVSGSTTYSSKLEASMHRPVSSSTTDTQPKESLTETKKSVGVFFYGGKLYYNNDDDFIALHDELYHNWGVDAIFRPLERGDQALRFTEAYLNYLEGFSDANSVQAILFNEKDYPDILEAVFNESGQDRDKAFFIYLHRKYDGHENGFLSIPFEFRWRLSSGKRCYYSSREGFIKALYSADGNLTKEEQQELGTILPYYFKDENPVRLTAMIMRESPDRVIFYDEKKLGTAKEFLDNLSAFEIEEDLECKYNFIKALREAESEEDIDRLTEALFIKNLDHIPDDPQAINLNTNQADVYLPEWKETERMRYYTALCVIQSKLLKNGLRFFDLDFSNNDVALTEQMSNVIYAAYTVTDNTVFALRRFAELLFLFRNKAIEILNPVELCKEGFYKILNDVFQKAEKESTTFDKLVECAYFELYSKMPQGKAGYAHMPIKYHEHCAPVHQLLETWLNRQETGKNKFCLEFAGSEEWKKYLQLVYGVEGYDKWNQEAEENIAKVIETREELENSMQQSNKKAMETLRHTGSHTGTQTAAAGVSEDEKTSSTPPNTKQPSPKSEPEPKPESKPEPKQAYDSQSGTSSVEDSAPAEPPSGKRPKKKGKPGKNDYSDRAGDMSWS